MRRKRLTAVSNTIIINPEFMLTIYGKSSCIREENQMKCPFCGEQETKVIDSRPADDNSTIRRRRQCESCGKRFTTYEKVETIPLIVIKKDENREPYDRSKIEKGILRSCNKRPVSADQIRTLVNEIENEIFNREEREIPTEVKFSIRWRTFALLPYTEILKTLIHLWMK